MGPMGIPFVPGGHYLATMSVPVVQCLSTSLLGLPTINGLIFEKKKTNCQPFPPKKKLRTLFSMVSSTLFRSRPSILGLLLHSKQIFMLREEMKSSELYHSKQKWPLSTMVESTKNTLPETNMFEPKNGGFQ